GAGPGVRPAAGEGAADLRAGAARPRAVRHDAARGGGAGGGPGVRRRVLPGTRALTPSPFRRDRRERSRSAPSGRGETTESTKVLMNAFYTLILGAVDAVRRWVGLILPIFSKTRVF